MKEMEALQHITDDDCVTDTISEVVHQPDGVVEYDVSKIENIVFEEAQKPDPGDLLKKVSARGSPRGVKQKSPIFKPRTSPVTAPRTSPLFSPRNVFKSSSPRKRPFDRKMPVPLSTTPVSTQDRPPLNLPVEFDQSTKAQSNWSIETNHSHLNQTKHSNRNQTIHSNRNQPPHRAQKIQRNSPQKIRHPATEEREAKRRKPDTNQQQDPKSARSVPSRVPPIRIPNFDSSRIPRIKTSPRNSNYVSSRMQSSPRIPPPPISPRSKNLARESVAREESDMYEPISRIPSRQKPNIKFKPGSLALKSKRRPIPNPHYSGKDHSPKSSRSSRISVQQRNSIRALTNLTGRAKRMPKHGNAYE